MLPLTNNELSITASSNSAIKFSFFPANNLCCSSDFLYLLFALLQQVPQVLPCSTNLPSLLSNTQSSNGIPVKGNQCLMLIISYRIESKSSVYHLKHLTTWAQLDSLILLLILTCPSLLPTMTNSFSGYQGNNLPSWTIGSLAQC